MTSSFLLQYFAKEHIHTSQAVVCGSTAIGARFRSFRSTEDIDLVLSFWKIGEQFISYRNVKQHCQEVSHIRVVEIPLVKRYKRTLKREKDLYDLAFLRLHEKECDV